MNIELSVIIVNYNGLKFLNACFKSLEQCLGGISHEIIVVDNASADASCDFIRQNYPAVVLIESKENLGFGKGNNLGVSAAKGEYVLLLNNDTIVQDNISPVLQMLKANPAIGAAGIRMLDAHKNYLISAGRFPGVFTLVMIKNISRLGKEFSTGSFSKDAYDVDWISGSFLMLPKRVYNEVKGFDEDYFMYVEDVDLCKKIASLGLRRVFLPRYSYIHFVGYDPSKDPLILKGWEMFIKKHYTGTGKRAALAALTVNRCVKRIKKFIN